MLLPFCRTLLATSLFLTASALAAPAGNLPQPLGVDQNVAGGEKAQSWQFSMPRLKGKPVDGSFTLIEGKQGWRGFIDFGGKTRRAVRDITWQDDGKVSFAVDTWMGDTRPVLMLKEGKFDGYFLIGNARYPATGDRQPAQRGSGRNAAGGA